MNAIPAKVAGVPELIMVVPTPDGEVNQLVMAAAAIAGVDRVFTIGGAQAVAALAYGTETIPKVDKITGPGNSFVATAKRMVFGVVGIDMIAGPSEILVVCDGKTNPDWIAMDLFSQAEHDEEAQSILVCPDEDFIAQVQSSIERLLEEMPRKDIIKTSLENRAVIISVANMEQAIEVANHIAPEHLELSVDDAEQWDIHGHSQNNCLELVDWCGRIIREDKKGAIENNYPDILQRLNIEASYFIYLSKHFEQLFTHLVGDGCHVKQACEEIGHHWVHGIRHCETFFSSR